VNASSGARATEQAALWEPGRDSSNGGTMRIVTTIVAAFFFLSGCAGMTGSGSGPYAKSAGSKTMSGHATVAATDLGGSRPAVEELDPRPVDKIRCECFETLARADENDCMDSCFENSSDATIDACLGRCENKFLNAMRRPMRQYNCPLEICDEGKVTRIVDIAYEDQELCEWKCDRPGRPQAGSQRHDECYETCRKKCNNKVWRKCDTFIRRHECPRVVTDVWCAEGAADPCPAE
jgi:hypothetical protein